MTETVTGIILQFIREHRTLWTRGVWWRVWVVLRDAAILVVVAFFAFAMVVGCCP